VENPEKNEDIFDKIKIFSSEDEKLKLLGELLSNKSSRDIIKLLIDKEIYTNEIVKKLDLKVSLVIHHLQKMESIGLLEITKKKIARNGKEHRFFRIPTGMLIVPNKSEEDTNNGFLKKIFKDGIKFAAIGFAAIISFITTIPKKKQTIESYIIDNEPSDFSDASEITIEKINAVINSDITYSDHLTQITTLIIVIGLGLFLIWYSKKNKNLVEL
jgi:predicted RNA binding protein YcfA (HicA-like mRNA interferase family)